MAMRSSRSRLLACALICLKLTECICILNAEPIPKDPLTFSESQDPLQKPPHDTPESDVTRTRESDRKGRIEASIIPLNSSESKPEYTQAEVRILIPSSPKASNPQADWLIRASSILMDYDEDTRKYFQQKDSVNSKPHRIRHQNHRKLPSGPITDDYFVPNEAQLDEPISREEIISELQTTSKPRSIVRIPVRALYYGEDQLIPRQVSRKKTHANKVKNQGNDTWIALHSPVRIYIPVRYNEDNSIPSNTKCVHCSPNITITVPRGETEVAVPAPAITVCSRLARTRGRINIAVVSGPRPGVRVLEGDYPTEIIVWKPGGHVFSCIYKLTVVAKKCDKISPPSGGSVDCLNGNFWGSKCKFSCFSGFVLQGHHTVTCEEHSNEVLWSSSFPICKNAVSAHAPSIKRLPCAKPLQPKNGTVICHSNSKNDYPDGSVCQYFCFPGFLIEHLLTTSSLIVCKNGQWTPNGNVSCLATYCSEPRSPSYGSMKCNHKGIKDTNVKSKYQNGTTCSFHCDSGYTIPKSLSSLNRIVCNAPHWNDSSILECKQMVAPYPHPKDCSNQTKIANRRGFVKLEPVRFYLKKNSLSSKTLMYGNCSYTGKTSVGTYINHCTSHDAELNTTGHCTYSITVKENSCSPPPKVLHASLQCETGDHKSYPRRTICKYICDDGYVIPIKERKFQSKVCMPKLKWRPPGFPTCQRAVPPKPRRGMCISQMLFLDGNDSTIMIKAPRFKSSLKGSKVRVNCSLSGPLQIGNYTNVCEAMDTQLGLSSSCKFEVMIQGKGCPSLPDVSFGLINCSETSNADYLPIGTICSYSCDEGNTIPTSLLAYSVKMCIGHHHWNSSLLPACVSQIPPVPAVDTCLNRSVTIENLIDVHIDIPELKSSSGAILESNCEPLNISTFAVHKINCSAFDPQLRVTGFCSFYLDVQNSNEIAELSREEVSCQHLQQIVNGYAQCNHNNSGVLPVGSICEVVCKENFTVPNSRMNQTAVECLPNGQWNLTNISECMKLESPILISGCADHARNVSNLMSLKVPLPIFLTSQNISAAVSCMPEAVENYGNHTISCIADDNELNTKSTCSFYFNLGPVINELDDLNSDFSTTISEPTPTVTISTTESIAKSCEQLSLPHHGFVNCSNNLSFQNCSVSCKEGYGFPSNYQTLQKGWIECDGTDGLWDYQRDHDSKHLPDCLGELPNTVVKVWLSFSSVVDHCDDASKDELKDFIKSLLMNRNEEMCAYVDCESSFQVNCSKDSQKDILYTNWTLQTLFNPADYENSRDVPDPETHIEKILDATHAAVTSDNQFRDDLLLNGMQLNEKSFQRGFFVLVCQKEGYAVDLNTNKCVECPSGTREQNGNCVKCPYGTFQLEPGQTVCEECPDATFFTQNVPVTCLDKDDDNVPSEETSFLSALIAS